MKKSIGAKTIAFPLPVWVVGTYDANSKPNMMTVSWCGICCSKPPCIQVSIRKETNSYSNIMRRKSFTVNIPSENYVKEVDYVGMVSSKMQDKFLATTLTPVKSSLVDAPYIEEFPINLECKVLHILEIGLHTLFVGEIMDIKVEETMFTEDGLPNITSVKPIVFAPETHTYHAVGNTIGKAFNIGSTLLNPASNKINF